MLTNEEIFYVVISNVDNLNIELKIELSQSNRKNNEIMIFYQLILN